VLEGDLGDFSLPDILQLLAFTSKTGRLTLRDGTSRGRIDVRGGQVVDVSADASRLPVARRLLGVGLVDGDGLRAALDGRDELPTDHDLVEALLAEAGEGDDKDALREVLRDQHLEAAAELLRWHEGDFAFDASASVSEGGPTTDVAGLIEEVEQRAAAASELEDRLGGGDQRVAIGRPDSDVTVPADCWGLLALVDGRRTIDDVVRLSGRGAYEAKRALVTLLELEVVSVGTDAGEVSDDELVAAHALLSELEATLGGAVPAAAVASAHPVDTGPSADPQPEQGEAAAADPEAPVALSAAPVDPPASEEASAADTSVSTLRTRVRNERLQADPSVDASLVQRLIDGVEALA
jgi:hypothetical protein